MLPSAADEREAQLDTAIASAVDAACHKAAELELRSLAFPLMGTRVARIPPETAVAATVRGIRDFLHTADPGRRHLETVYFSYFRSATARQAFIRELSTPDNAGWIRHITEQ